VGFDPQILHQSSATGEDAVILHKPVI